MKAIYIKDFGKPPYWLPIDDRLTLMGKQLILVTPSTQTIFHPQVYQVTCTSKMLTNKQFNETLEQLEALGELKVFKRKER